MDMEVMIPSMDYNFDSNSTTPYITAPSSPQRYANFFYSAPASPTRISAFCSAAATPTSSNYGDADHDADFAFDFSGHLERASLPADELFDGGKIKPLKPPPPPFHHDSPKSPRKTAAAVEESGADRRGRERNSKTTWSSRERNKGSSRSLSPFRVSDLLFDPELNEEDDHQSQNRNNTTSSLFSFSSSWYKKWKIKDLLLFRSASESRAKDKEEMKKYSQLKKSREADVKNSSFRSTESAGSVSSRRRSGPPISAHELHYTVNRAFSEEMRKRTTLPYKQGLWGCLGFNPTLPEISKGISPAASMSRG